MSQNTHKRLAVIQSAGPDQAAAREALDVVLNAAALDLPVQLILRGPALLNLCAASAGVNGAFGVKGINKKYAMLALYDVAAPWVLEAELSQWQSQFQAAQMQVPELTDHQAISEQQLHNALAEFDHVLCF